MLCMLSGRRQHTRQGGLRFLAAPVGLAPLSVIAVRAALGSSHIHLVGGLMPCLLWVRGPSREYLSSLALESI